MIHFLRLWRKGTERRKVSTEQKCKLAKLYSHLGSFELDKEYFLPPLPPPRLRDHREREWWVRGGGNDRNMSYRPKACVFQNSTAALILMVFGSGTFGR